MSDPSVRDISAAQFENLCKFLLYRLGAADEHGKSMIKLGLSALHSYSSAIQQSIRFCALSGPIAGITSLSVRFRKEDPAGFPGLKQLGKALRTRYLAVRNLHFVGAPSSLILDFLRVDEQEAVQVPFPHLDVLFITLPRLQQTETRVSRARDYFVKDLADCFYNRTNQYGAPTLQHLVIDGERIAPGVLSFYGSFTCGTINMDNTMNPPNIHHDMASLQTFLSMADIDVAL
ncbi:hypothetical protein DENSPDRAFT_508394 [Dentipellis sp. KUC8613]|nr:hypothetical protein DENSPDRAFT_508394 [Dentipellis sp. KUC8613]